MTFASLSAYVLNYVEANAGSTRSLANLLSNLHCSYLASRNSWLDASDTYLLKRLMIVLRYRDTTPSRRMDPATLVILELVLNSMNLMEDAHLYDAVSYTLAHNGLLRGGELWSGLTAISFRWNRSRTSFALFLPRTKTHLFGDGVYVTYHQFRGRCCVVPLLRAWFTRFDLWNNPKAFVFPRWTGIVARPFDWLANGSKRSWVKRFRARIGCLGLDSSRFSGHSFRPGGATDLFSSKVPLATVMKAGRWKSPESALIYFREDDEVASAAAAAFGLCY